MVKNADKDNIIKELVKDVNEMKAKLANINCEVNEDDDEDLTDEEKEKHQKYAKSSSNILDEMEKNITKLRKNSKEIKSKFRSYCEQALDA